MYIDNDHCYIKKQPVVLIIDSGIGGLSIYIQVKQVFPNMHYLYFIDSEGFPYGEKTESFIITRMICIINAVLKRHVLDLVIIACNTASVVSLFVLRKIFIFPIVGVFPEIKLAVQLTSNGIVGLLATCVTIQSKYIINLVKQYSCVCSFLFLGSSQLVRLAEDKKYGGIVDISVLRKLLSPWLELVNFPDIVILGCTHFVFLRDDLHNLFPDNVKLIDSFASVIDCITKAMYLYIVNQDFFVKKIGKDLLYCSIFTDKISESMLFMKNYGFNFFEVISV